MAKLSEAKKEELRPILEKYDDHPFFTQSMFAMVKTDEEADKLIEYIRENPDTDSCYITVFVLFLGKQREKSTN